MDKPTNEPLNLNRRQFRRDAMFGAAWMAEVDETGEYVSAWQCETTDLSRGGIGLKSIRMIHTGRNVAVEIINARNERMTVLYGVVRQCRYLEGHYAIGIEFEKFTISKSLEGHLSRWKSRAESQQPASPPSL